MSKKFIKIKGANENNLKDVNVEIPKEKLIVFTGVSGSGKSSLAFNTIYEEGRRRYVDSLSSYARQFLGGTNKPDVESIEGLSPAISIEQKTTHNNPRSTVGTVTEIYDYLRLLYARVGVPYCPKHKKPISAQRTQDIINTIFKHKEGTKLIIYSPVAIKEKGTHANLLESLRTDGFVRVEVDGKMMTLDDKIELNKTQQHSISIVVDRIVLNEENRTRISDAVEIALEHASGIIEVGFDQEKRVSFSRNFSCPSGDFDMPLIEPRLFSFNAPAGMCDSCKGIGIKLKVNKKLLIPDSKRAISEGGIVYFANLVGSENIEWMKFSSLLNHHGINMDIPIENLSKEELEIALYGTEEPIEYTIVTRTGTVFKKFEPIEGVAALIERRYRETTSEKNRKWYKSYMKDVKCGTCKGARLNKFALSMKVDELNINEFTQMPIDQAFHKVTTLKLNDEQQKVSELIINELYERLSFLINVGLTYISLDRKAGTLSGGESQRIRLATQIGSNLTGVLYVLDEPSIGLHQVDNDKLIKTLKKMVDIGNTLIVVEHDEDTIREADYIVDIGPLAGDAGGNVVAAGTLEEITKNKESITGLFLSGKESIEIPTTRRSGNGQVIELKGVKENNLKNINVKFPLGKLIVVTGVSGSGKSTLVNEVLSKALEQKIKDPLIIPGKFKSISGNSNIDKVIRISQSPIGRTPRSNPATYTSLFDDVRELYSMAPEAKARGYSKGRFSFNVDGGRCDKCRGDGLIKIEMHFLPDVSIICNHCDGKRFNRETLEVKFKGKNISDILNMRVSEAYLFFSSFTKIKTKLQALMDVGLNYITLGQNATTLSGGEAQRVKLATYLQKKPTGKTLFILDEPTTGLHSYDVKHLLKVLNRIVEGGDTVLMIEHNLDVIKTADYVIDLGPEGGINGGDIIATGTPEQVALKENSKTGFYLKKILKLEG
ncbi:excinuclease ABC subunit UvrA [Mycoplasma marinum]|uniref:UvrABC system protein A n=1 Tax=Mycoplasma marinum TaxID=1937190 RepID=A0A4R0XSD6_9MOLU|nr:excinuclease ABC subunit UvrA [Mycoplasma marinum]TCG11788.1 excinuclease ABC subunit UvrA [Mycoplasma marinum]